MQCRVLPKRLDEPRLFIQNTCVKFHPITCSITDNLGAKQPFDRVKGVQFSCELANSACLAGSCKPRIGFNLTKIIGKTLFADSSVLRELEKYHHSWKIVIICTRSVRAYVLAGMSDCRVDINLYAPAALLASQKP